MLEYLVDKNCAKCQKEINDAQITPIEMFTYITNTCSNCNYSNRFKIDTIIQP